MYGNNENTESIPHHSHRNNVDVGEWIVQSQQQPSTSIVAANRPSFGRVSADVTTTDVIVGGATAETISRKNECTLVFSVLHINRCLR